MSSSAVVVPTENGKPAPADAAKVTPMSGGAVLSPLPLNGGRRRKTRRVSKKVLAMIKRMPKSKLNKLMKGGEMEEPVAEEEMAGSSRRKSRRGGKRHSRRRHAFLY